VHVPHDSPPEPLYSIKDDHWKIENVSYEYRKHFGRTLIAVDKSVKRIADELNAANMMNSSYLVVASDNGGCPSDGSNNFPLRGGKFDMFEGGVRVPSFIYSPMLPESVWGTKNDNLFHVTDWLPTLHTIAAPTTALPPGLDGVNQLPGLIEGTSKSPPRKEVLLGLNRWDVSPTLAPLALHFDDVQASALIYNKYKYIMGQVDRGHYDPNLHPARNCTCGIKTTPTYTYLFDLEEDPTEQHNLLDDLPDLAAYFKLKMRAYFNNAMKSQWKPPEMDVCIDAWSQTGYITPWHSPGAAVEVKANDTTSNGTLS